MFSRTNVGLLTDRGLPPSPRTRPRTNWVLPAPSSPCRATHSPPRSVAASSAAIASVCSTLVDVRFTRDRYIAYAPRGKKKLNHRDTESTEKCAEKDKLILSAFAF